MIMWEVNNVAVIVRPFGEGSVQVCSVIFGLICEGPTNLYEDSQRCDVTW